MNLVRQGKDLVWEAYDIHDNGGVFFKVSVCESKRALVITRCIPDDADECRMYREVGRYWYRDLFIGYDPTEPKFKGNSILFRPLSNANDSWIYVGGHEIYGFSPIAGDQIVNYVSPVRNSDVPYPFAVGKKYVYLMLERVAFPIRLWIQPDPYTDFYKGSATDIRKF
jgi:hypothetical protein